MNCLIPISLFFIAYKVGQGRPFSIFEQTVLNAINENITTIDKMYNTLFVHRRIILETLVTLTQSGMVILGGPTDKDSEFILTSYGKSIISGDDEPTKFFPINRTCIIAMERVTGDLILANYIRSGLIRKRDIIDDLSYAAKIKPVYHENNLDEAEIYRYLPKSKKQWLHNIDTIKLQSKNNLWLRVNVDTVDKLIVGLPLKWQNRLTPYLFDECEIKEIQNFKYKNIDENQTMDEDSKLVNELNFNLSKDSILLGIKKHEEIFEKALNEVQQNLFISSTKIDIDCLIDIEDKLNKLQDKKINIDILINDRLIDSKSIEKYITKVNYNRKKNDKCISLRLVKSSEIKSNILAWDTIDGFNCVIGGYQWIRNTKGKESECSLTSVIVHKFEFFPEIARFFASICSETSQKELSSVSDRWRNIASSHEKKHALSEEQESTETYNCRLSILFDRRHQQELFECFQQSQLITKIQTTAIEINLKNNNQPKIFEDSKKKIKLIVKEDARTTVDQENIGANQTNLIKRRNIKSNYFICDNNFCVSTYPFCTSDATDLSFRYIGVLFSNLTDFSLVQLINSDAKNFATTIKLT